MIPTATKIIIAAKMIVMLPKFWSKNVSLAFKLAGVTKSSISFLICKFKVELTSSVDSFGYLEFMLRDDIALDICKFHSSRFNFVPLIWRTCKSYCMTNLGGMINIWQNKAMV